MFTWAPNPVRRKQTDGPTRNDWEHHKDLILGEYRKYGLAHVKEYMRIHHNFIARDEQWNYRLYKFWNVKHPKAANRSKNTGNIAEHAGGVQPAEVSANSRIGNIIPPATIHEEQEFHTPSAEPLRRTSMYSEASSSNAIRWGSGSPNWPLFDRVGYASNNTHPSVSSRSASPYERNNSAASSYYQLDGVKRSASLSSQSSAPSSKRVKSSGWRSAVSTPTPLEDEDEEQAALMEPFNPLKVTKICAERQGARDFVQSRHPPDDWPRPRRLNLKPTTLEDEDKEQAASIDPFNPLKDAKICADRQGARDFGQFRHPPNDWPRPRRLNLKPMITKRELVFPCFQSPSRASYVRVRNVNPHALPEQCTDNEDIVDISSLPWEDMHNLSVAAEIFSACRMHRQAFKMHYQILSRILETTSCPWENAKDLLLRHILACSRTAETRLDLVKSRSILNDQLDDSSTNHNVKSVLRLRMALADICMKQGDWNGVREHRALACELLCEDDQSIILDECNATPDFVADFTALHAHALKASMDTYLQKGKVVVEELPA